MSAPEPEEVGLAIGHGQVVVFVVREEDGPKVGLIHHHPGPDGRNCNGGMVLFDLPENRRDWPNSAVWQVVSMDPLHLEPSLLCTICGNHGFIRDGKWVPA